MNIHTINNHCVRVDTPDHKNGTWTASVFSYDTLVLSIDGENKIHRHWSGWSATTQRDINKAVNVNMSKKLWDSLPVE